jgi:1-acylglycerone phosphate reductase
VSRNEFGGLNCSRLILVQDCTVPAIDISDEDILSTFETNIFSVIKIVRELSPLLIRARGKIVNIGSITAVTPYVFSSVYNATKGALHAYSDTLRLELAPFGVRVILIVTGGVRSRITRTERILKDDSLYLPISEEYHHRVHHSQGENTHILPRTSCCIF